MATPSVHIADPSIYDSAWTAHTALGTSLSAESLLFAAFGLSFTLATSTRDGGRSAVLTRGWFGLGIVVLLTLLALSAVNAWWAAFPNKNPKYVGGWVSTYALLVAAVAQPLLAFAANCEARRK